MCFYVAITDGNWFARLSQGEPPDEVNFWQPSPGPLPHAGGRGMVAYLLTQRGRARLEYFQQLGE